MAAIKDDGPISVFCYQAMLGMMMQGRHRESWRLFSDIGPLSESKGASFSTLSEMKSILMQQLNHS